MKKPPRPPADVLSAADLEERLSRYRSRLAAEGRPRAAAKLDQAIADAKKT